MKFAPKFNEEYDEGMNIIQKMNEEQIFTNRLNISHMYPLPQKFPRQFLNLSGS